MTLPSPFAPPSGTPFACASENQMKQRTSVIFYTNVIYNFILELLTIFFSLKTIPFLQKHSGRLFTTSSNILLQWTLVCGIFHSVVYFIIQLTSLLRSIRHPDDPCAIMFNEYECWLYHFADIFARLWLTFNYVFLMFDGTVSCFVPRIKSTKLRANLFQGLSVICSLLMAHVMTSDGPNTNILSNCLSRQGRDLNELTRQVGSYAFTYAACIGLMAVTWTRAYRNHKARVTNISKRFDNRMNYETSRFLFVATLLAMLVMLVYPSGVIFIIAHLEYLDPAEIGNYVLWTYQFNLATFLLPILIILFAKRTFRIRAENLVKQQAINEDHFLGLSSAWDAKFEAQKSLRVQRLGRRNAVAPDIVTVEVK